MGTILIDANEETCDIRFQDTEQPSTSIVEEASDEEESVSEKIQPVATLQNMREKLASERVQTDCI